MIYYGLISVGRGHWIERNVIMYSTSEKKLAAGFVQYIYMRTKFHIVEF